MFPVDSIVLNWYSSGEETRRSEFESRSSQRFLLTSAVQVNRKNLAILAIEAIPCSRTCSNCMHDTPSKSISHWRCYLQRLGKVMNYVYVPMRFPFRYRWLLCLTFAEGLHVYLLRTQCRGITSFRGSNVEHFMTQT